jgi:hypothetical protein
MSIASQSSPISAHAKRVVPVPQNGSRIGSFVPRHSSSCSRTQWTEYAGVRRSQPWRVLRKLP